MVNPTSKKALDNQDATLKKGNVFIALNI